VNQAFGDSLSLTHKFLKAMVSGKCTTKLSYGFGAIVTDSQD
jgi:hypothetical protein